MRSITARAAILVLAMSGSALAQAPPLVDTKPREEHPFDPAYYVKIYEEAGDRRVVLYDPKMVATSPTLLRVDADSKIVIQIDPTHFGPDLALNGLFMTAELSRVDGPVKVEVLNYSEVAADPKTQASQAGVALRTASDVHVMLRNLHDVIKDLIGALYQDACLQTPPPGKRHPDACTYRLKNDVDADAVLQSHLRAFQPRIDSIVDFFTSDKNALILSEIGSQVFRVDVRSLKAMAAKFRTDVATMINGEPEPRRRAGADLRLSLPMLWDDMQPLRTLDNQSTELFETTWRKTVLPHFRDILAPGTIDLRKYKAADGETLTLTIQARGAGGEGSGGVSHDFQIGIRKYKARVTTEPSAFYLRRLGTVLDDKGQPVATNFSAAPGVTFGPVFYSRGLKQTMVPDGKDSAGKEKLRVEWSAEYTPWSRFLSALAPGIGMNVSLMNFSANDFDPSVKNAAGQVVGGFRTTTSSSIQVGAGLTASLFANAVQVTHGWNLNVSEKRAYWGIGFGFVQIGQEIAKVAKK